MMMKVGLEISAASMPRPIATPRARTVLPVPSSPESAKTSFGRAIRPRRSPRRSVWSEEWLTRSSQTTSRDRSPTRGAALELPALETESRRSRRRRCRAMERRLPLGNARDVRALNELLLALRSCLQLGLEIGHRALLVASTRWRRLAIDFVGLPGGGGVRDADVC